MQAVSAGQVEHPQGLAGWRDKLAFLALDGDAGVVGHLLATAGQQIEQRRLAAVRIAHQCHQRTTAVDVDDRFVHTEDSTRTQAASACRKANVDKPTRTTSECPPKALRANS